jgi:hypothetical protein
MASGNYNGRRKKMDVQHYIARENIERVILNYKNLNVIEEKYAAAIMGAVDSVLGFTGYPVPKGKIIPFPGVKPIPEPEAPPPEPPRPKYSAVWENLTTQGLKVNYKTMYAVYDSGGYDPEKIAAISAGELIKHRGVGAGSIKKLRAFLQSKGLDLKE